MPRHRYGLPEPGISNCLIWSLWMRATRGGRLRFRKSEHGPWLHVAWSRDGSRWFTYNPVWPKSEWTRSGPRKRPPFFFRGRVQRDLRAHPHRGIHG